MVAKLTVSLAFFLSSFFVNAFDSNSKNDKGHSSCDVCPEMVVVPQGEFEIGSVNSNEDERPQKQVSVNAFQVSRFEITRAQYEVFISETQFNETSPCYVMHATGKWYQDDLASWRSPGFQQDDNHPVVCVSWNAAKAYVEWLNSKIGASEARFRLLT